MVKMAEPTINDLPKNILLHILSFLPATRDSIFTTFVSRKWRNLWLSTPSLDFFHFTRSHHTLEHFRRFAAFVDKTLIRRPPNCPLHSFSICLTLKNGMSTSQIDSWIRYAVSHDVENLDLDLNLNFLNVGDTSAEQNINVGFEFPFYVLRDSQVRVLNLYSCSLSLPPADNNTPPPRFFSLRSVKLDGVRMTDRIFADLVAACVNLEVLVLSAVIGCKDFKICSSKLKELKLEFLSCEEGSVEIVAPNLYALTIKGFYVGDYALRDAYSLVEAYVHMDEYQYWVKVMRLVGRVNHLCTSNWWFELMMAKDVSECFILQNLKCVELGTSYTTSHLIGILLLLALSPNLQTMILDNYSIFSEISEESISEDFIKQLIFNSPRLRHVKMNSFMGMEGEKKLLLVLLKTAVILEKIVLIPAVGVGLEETPQPPIVLDTQFKGHQDLGYFVSQIPKRRILD